MSLNVLKYDLSATAAKNAEFVSRIALATRTREFMCIRAFLEGRDFYVLYFLSPTWPIFISKDARVARETSNGNVRVNGSNRAKIKTDSFETDASGLIFMKHLQIAHAFRTCALSNIRSDPLRM